MICKLAVSGLLLAGISAGNSGAQLAITEVMSEASLETNPGFNRPDYWELTNFGTNGIRLDDYSFSDSRQTDALIRYPFTNLVIRPVESIIFFRDQPNRSSVTNAARFRQWWGESQLPPALQIRTYLSPGFNGDAGDELWVYDAQSNVVDSVRFGQARTGRSFVYDPESGLFGLFSVRGIYEAFQAERGQDYGSPGTTAGPSALRIVRQPSDASVDAGAGVTFTVAALGLPRPRYQWLAKGLAIAGATAASLTLTNVQRGDAGSYYVRVDNGLSNLMSETVTLRVNMNPTLPAITAPPVDLTVFPGQTAVFSVQARGYPAPHYQWRSNGVDILGATGQTLAVASVVLDMSGTCYTVQLWNDLGATNASAVLTVIHRPGLRFTEVMPRPIYPDSSRHYNWFEVTNYDTNAVNLQGYRFFDTPTFAGAFTITNAIVVRPGESIVFVEEMSAAAFWLWWGAENAWPGLQVYTYRGFSLRSEFGEELYLWNAAADPYDPLATVTWAGSTEGVSLECMSWCDEANGCIGECLIDSILGVNGAYQAASQGDIGSPGCIANPPPRILSITHDGSKTRLRCRVNPGKSYRLKWTPGLAGDAWMELGTYPASEAVLWLEDAGAASKATCFYRLEETL